MVRSARNKSPAVTECQLQGMTQRETAKKLGMSLSCVQTHWKRIGQNGRPGFKNLVEPMLYEGKTDKEISRALNISVSTVNRWRRQLNN